MIYTTNREQLPFMSDFTLPVYYELNGKVAKIEPTSDGGALVTVPENMNIADFADKGTVITDKEYKKLLRSSKTT